MTRRAHVWAEAARLPTEHRVRNLSPSGACLDHASRLKLGASIRVSIGHVADIPALVAWIKAESAGVEFEYPIDLVAARRHFPAGRPGQAIYARTGRLWTLMWAHAAFDLTALALIYWDVEPKVAPLVFG